MSAAAIAEPTPLYTRIGQHEVHPAANIFPLLEGAAFDALCDDIKEHGLRTPIVRAWVDDEIANNGTRKPVVLDGRNRLRACIRVGAKIQWCDHQGGDLVAFVVSQNLHRRHMNDGQRAMVAARIATLDAHRPGSPPNGGLMKAPSQPQAASMLNVSERLVQRAKRVLTNAKPEIVAAVDRGDMPVTAAENKIIERFSHGHSPNSRAALARALEPKLQERAERDAQIGSLLADGMSVDEVAKELEVSRGCVFDAKRRLGLSKRGVRADNPLSGLTDYAIEFTDAWEGALANPERWERATAEQRRELLLKLRGLVAVTRRLITRLNKEAGNEGDENE